MEGAMFKDLSSQKISTTMTIKKFDHEKAEEPELIETLKVKDGKIIERIVPPEPST
jgi:hypothetical protein